MSWMYVIAGVLRTPGAVHGKQLALFTWDSPENLALESSLEVLKGNCNIEAHSSIRSDSKAGRGLNVSK